MRLALAINATTAAPPPPDDRKDPVGDGAFAAMLADMMPSRNDRPDTVPAARPGEVSEMRRADPDRVDQDSIDRIDQARPERDSAEAAEQQVAEKRTAEKQATDKQAGEAQAEAGQCDAGKPAEAAQNVVLAAIMLDAATPPEADGTAETAAATAEGPKKGEAAEPGTEAERKQADAAPDAAQPMPLPVMAPPPASPAGQAAAGESAGAEPAGADAAVAALGREKAASAADQLPLPEPKADEDGGAPAPGTPAFAQEVARQTTAVADAKAAAGTQPTAAHAASAGEQVSVHIGRAAHNAGSGDRIRIQLSPEALGKVDVQLDLGSDGQVQAVIRADRPETLHLLMHDAKHLVRGLQEAGYQASSASLQFSLSGDGDGRRQPQPYATGREQRGGTAGSEAGTAEIVMKPAGRTARGGIDISI